MNIPVGCGVLLNFTYQDESESIMPVFSDITFLDESLNLIDVCPL